MADQRLLRPVSGAYSIEMIQMPSLLLIVVAFLFLTSFALATFVSFQNAMVECCTAPTNAWSVYKGGSN